MGYLKHLFRYVGLFLWTSNTESKNIKLRLIILRINSIFEIKAVTSNHLMQ